MLHIFLILLFLAFGSLLFWLYRRRNLKVVVDQFNDLDIFEPQMPLGNNSVLSQPLNSLSAQDKLSKPIIQSVAANKSNSGPKTQPSELLDLDLSPKSQRIEPPLSYKKTPHQSAAVPLSEEDNGLINLPNLPSPDIPTYPNKQVDMVVNELVDIDQQADFLIALGNEQAAIELLSNHAIQEANPSAYLKLLEIYSHRSEQMAYEQLRFRFNRRFNVNVAQYGEDPINNRSLDEYPVVMAKIESSWSDPQAALKVLDSLIIKQEGPNLKLDLAAFRDLLLLSAILKDCIDHSRQNRLKGRSAGMVSH